MAEKAKIAVLISGAGTNMAALVYASRMPECPYEVVLVASNNPEAAGLALAKGPSKELAPHNILVNVVAVGKIKSMQQARRAAKTGKTVEQHYADTGKTVPMGRVGESEEVANVIAFLASDAASYVTGCCINVDGGLSGVL